MARKHVSQKFSGVANFVNMGLAIASALMCWRFSGGGEPVPETAIAPPAFCFALSALVAAFGVVRSGKRMGGFDAFRDGLPLVCFALANLASGNQKSWPWLFLAVGLTMIIILLLMRKHGGYDDDDDRITIEPRWPL